MKKVFEKVNFDDTNIDNINKDNENNLRIVSPFENSINLCDMVDIIDDNYDKILEIKEIRDIINNSHDKKMTLTLMIIIYSAYYYNLICKL